MSGRERAIRKSPLLKILRQGLRLRVRCQEACSVAARATISRRAARRLGLRSRRARTPVGFARARLSEARLGPRAGALLEAASGSAARSASR